MPGLAGQSPACFGNYVYSQCHTLTTASSSSDTPKPLSIKHQPPIRLQVLPWMQAILVQIKKTNAPWELRLQMHIRTQLAQCHLHLCLMSMLNHPRIRHIFRHLHRPNTNHVSTIHHFSTYQSNSNAASPLNVNPMFSFNAARSLPISTPT